MILDPWSVALVSCSVVALFLAFAGVPTSWEVLRYWDIGSDSQRQISLEQKLSLSAALVQFGLIVELVSIVLFILAADHFSTILKGAMCAAGALTANKYGNIALGMKLGTFFFAAFWLILHRLDLSSESYPLVKHKVALLLFLLPLLVGETGAMLVYLLALEPEIITSCCGVIFGQEAGDGFSFMGYQDHLTLLGRYGAVSVLLGAGIVFQGILFHRSRAGKGSGGGRLLFGWNIALWASFYLFSLQVITVIVSPYVYALPHHRCPFDLLKQPYAVIGVPLYLFLHVGVIAGIAAATARLVGGMPGLERTTGVVQRYAMKVNLACITLFVGTAAWAPVAYLISGGES